MKNPIKPFKIHFVCRGNTFRSRLAAAYMDTVSGKQFAVSSSGIAALQATPKIVESYTKAVARTFGLTHGITDAKTQTTNQLLAEADVIVFMNKDVYDDTQKEYEFDIRKTVVWHVADIDPAVKHASLVEGNQQLVLDAASNTYARIRGLCDELYEYLTHTPWVDVADAENRSTGLRLPLGWVTDRGLWHRGVHVVAQTSDGKFVVGKRANSIVFAPGMLEISLGGGIDAGESPIQAAVRETHEELGVHVPEKHFRPLFMYRLNSFHPRYNKRTRGHVYVYAVTLPLHSQLAPQISEVAELRTLTKRQVLRMLRMHRVAHFGRLKWNYELYKKAVAYSLHP